MPIKHCQLKKLPFSAFKIYNRLKRKESLNDKELTQDNSVFIKIVTHLLNIWEWGSRKIYSFYEWLFKWNKSFNKHRWDN